MYLDQYDEEKEAIEIVASQNASPAKRIETSPRHNGITPKIPPHQPVKQEDSEHHQSLSNIAEDLRLNENKLEYEHDDEHNESSDI